MTGPWYKTTWVDSAPVSKANVRTGIKEFVPLACYAAQLREMNTGGHLYVLIDRGANYGFESYSYDPSDISTADDDFNCIVSADGNRYKRRFSNLYYISNRLGVGTQYPAYPMHVIGGTSYALLFSTSDYDGSTSGTALGFYFGANTGATTARLQSLAGAGTANLVLNPYGGNIGVIQPSPAYNLDVTGTGRFTGALTKGSGTFRIDHPLYPADKDLVHGFVEAPRYELIYRGVAILDEGRASIDIDIASGMSEGTFAALTQNAQVFGLVNLSGFARLKPSAIVGGSFEILCEDPLSSDRVSWAVIAERADPFIRGNPDASTDSDGHLIPEHDKQ